MYKRQGEEDERPLGDTLPAKRVEHPADARIELFDRISIAVSYTHLRAHETVLDLVCRLLLEKKKKQKHNQAKGTLRRKSNRYTKANTVSKYHAKKSHEYC